MRPGPDLANMGAEPGSLLGGWVACCERQNEEPAPEQNSPMGVEASAQVDVAPELVPGTHRARAGPIEEKLFEAISVKSLVLTPVTVEGNGAVAFEVATQELVVEPTVEGFKRVRQHLTVYRKQSDGSWKIAAAMSGNQ